MSRVGNCSLVVIFQHVGFGSSMERVSVAWMATVKPQGWVYVALGMGVPNPTFTLLNGYH